MGESVDGDVHDDGDGIADGNLLRVHVNLFPPNVTTCSSKKGDFCRGEVFHEGHIFFTLWK